jgi:pimeloyl-ACP methyl ester carboxylesterase
MDLRADLPAITAPTLVVVATDDPATPPEHAEVIAAGIGHAKLELVDDAAHIVSVEQSERVTSLLLDHLVPGTG